MQDFAISNINGQSVLTYIDRGRGAGTILIIDESYEVIQELELTPGGINGHEFDVHNGETGTRVFALIDERLDYSEEQSRQVGYAGRCGVLSEKIVEYNATTWEETWSWRESDHIGLKESTYSLEMDLRQRCGDGWDYLYVRLLLIDFLLPWNLSHNLF